MKDTTTRIWKRRRLQVSKIIGSSFSGAIGIGAVALLSQITNFGFMIPPFGATCVIAFVIPKSAFAQPRSIIGGHVFSSAIGILCWHFFGNSWWTYSLAVAASMAVMQITRTLHPPAAADPVLILMQGGVMWDFLLFPVFAGGMVLVVIAAIYNRLIAKKYT